MARTMEEWKDYYLAHTKHGESKYDWSTGTNSSEYNHDYWEKNKERILQKRKESKGVRDFGGKGVGNKARSDDGSSYNNMEDWSDELTDEEKERIKKHNETVEDNIKKVTETVENYIKEHPEMSEEAKKKLRKDLADQISIAREQMISTKNSDDYEYIKGTKASSSKKKSSKQSDDSGYDDNAEKRARQAQKKQQLAVKVAESREKRNSSGTTPRPSTRTAEQQQREANRRNQAYRADNPWYVRGARFLSNQFTRAGNGIQRFAESLASYRRRRNSSR